MLDYVHTELNNEVRCIAGYYLPQREVRLAYDGREVLYVVGQAVVDSSCCGSGSWAYVLVPGFIVSWQGRSGEAGPVTEVEPVADEAARNRVRQLIEAKEHVSQIEFW
ncbi:MAG: hypothetical protein HY670_09420 [Chloroflexi bacterium]|nr:hypothetical protein [Chloroflexota bacterium]